MQIKIFDADTIDELVWPDTEESKMAQTLLLPMMKEGTASYIENVETTIYLLQVNDHLLPLTVNQKEYNNSYITSNYFPIKYLEEQLDKGKNSFPLLRKSIIRSMGSFLKALKINKTVIVNNWLLSTNIYPTLSDAEWTEVTEFLKTEFPNHVLMFRNVNDHACHDLKNELLKQRYRFIYSRHVYIYDPQQKVNFSPKIHYHHRRDRRLVGSEGYELVRYKQIEPEESKRLLKLYASIYLSRHTSYSPQYTERYLLKALESNFLELVAVKKENTIQGVIGFHQKDEKMIAPFFGYNEQYGAPNHLYRMLTMLAIDEAESRAVSLYDGSGGEDTKQRRGMKPFPEYLALYDRHLPLYRRLLWKMAEKVVRKCRPSSS